MRLHAEVSSWTLREKELERTWRCRDFAAAIAFIDRVAEVAEAEGHHPDLHLTAYRDLRIVLWTHAAGGLTPNDFILAAKIDRLEGPA